MMVLHLCSSLVKEAASEMYGKISFFWFFNLVGTIEMTFQKHNSVECKRNLRFNLILRIAAPSGGAARL